MSKREINFFVFDIFVAIVKIKNTDLDFYGIIKNKNRG